MTRYLFGDSDVAERRLKILADVYADSTASFVLGAVDEKPRLLLDLGCGPGYTTHLLADVLGCKQAAGLDNSRHFINTARKSATARVSFHLHDVTRVPFPVAPADLLFCRFLMTHLRDPEVLLSRWATQLNSGGLLLMEEVEGIQTSNKSFISYLEIVEAMIKAQKGNLYIGPILNEMKIPETLKIVSSAVKRLSVPAHKAASMFSLNIETWKHVPFVLANYSSSLIEDLEKTLKRLAVKTGAGSKIEWQLRQIVFERR